MRVCSAIFESLLAGLSGRVVRIEVEVDSMISSVAGRLREVMEEIVDVVEHCEVRNGVVEVVRERSIPSSFR